MGQGLNNVTQDVLIRFERMRGREPCGFPAPTTPASLPRTWWSASSDGGQSRSTFGREAFVARVWAFVKETGARFSSSSSDRRVL